MNELVIISGKGGTGKTSVTASFAVLAHRPVIADCDVDAADLHLVLSPQVRDRHTFTSGHEAVIRPGDCIDCGTCQALCRFDAIARVTVGSGDQGTHHTRFNCLDCTHCVRSCPIRTDYLVQEMAGDYTPAPKTVYAVDPLLCEGCGVCARFCPAGAIDFPERVCGEWMVSDTRCGPMVHARLGTAAENSGKLVSTVRSEARRIAEENGHDLVIVDGPPGIGCPVIASVTGATHVLVVTEPTLSGEHDLERALGLARHFGIGAAVCINKWDLNPDIADRIERSAREAGVRIAGRIRYDTAVTHAQMGERAVVETDAPSAGDIRDVWHNLNL